MAHMSKVSKQGAWYGVLRWAWLPCPDQQHDLGSQLSAQISHV